MTIKRFFPQLYNRNFENSTGKIESYDEALAFDVSFWSHDAALKTVMVKYNVNKRKLIKKTTRMNAVFF